MEEQKYINIPYNILRRRDLSNNAKLLYGLVQGFWAGDFQASNEWIGKTLGISSRSAQRAVKELKQQKVILSQIIVENGAVKGRKITLVKDL